MAFQLSPGKLGFKLGEVLVGLQNGTTDTPETIASTQNKLHTLGYVWNTETLSYEVETKVKDVSIISPIATGTPAVNASSVVVRMAPGGDGDYAGRAAFNGIFGDRLVGWKNDDISIQFQYNNSTRDVKEVVSGSGAVSNANSMASVEITTTAGSSEITSVDSLRYRPGHDAIFNFTSVYSGAQAGVKSYHGVLNSLNGAAFGYSGADFGIWIVEGGVETHTPRSSWNLDKCDGTGFSGFNLDPTKLNIYMVNYGWLGIAPIIYSVYGGLTKGWIACHVIDRVNTATTPHLDNPSLPMKMKVVRASGTGTAATIKSGSWRGGTISGEEENNSSNRWFAYTVLDATISGSGVRNAIFTIRNKSTFFGKPNHVSLEIGVVTFDNSANKSIAFYGVNDATITGNSAYADLETANSVVDISTGGTITAGTRGPATVIKSGNDRRTELLGTGLVLAPGQTFTFEAGASAAITGTMSISARWIERF